MKEPFDAPDIVALGRQKGFNITRHRNQIKYDTRHAVQNTLSKLVSNLAKHISMDDALSIAEQLSRSLFYTLEVRQHLDQARGMQALIDRHNITMSANSWIDQLENWCWLQDALKTQEPIYTADRWVFEDMWQRETNFETHSADVFCEMQMNLDGQYEQFISALSEYDTESLKAEYRQVIRMIKLQGHISGFDAKIELDLASADKSIELANALLAEAVAARMSTIPDNAYIEINARPFYGVSVRESGDQIFFLWRASPQFYIDRDTSYRSFFCSVSVSGEQPQWKIHSVDIRSSIDAYKSMLAVAPESLRSISTSHQTHGLRWLSDSNDESIAALYLMSAAILRDFWVVEDRESILGQARLRIPQGTTSSRRAIYLPRIRYHKSLIEQSSTQPSGTWSISTHVVKSHIRSLPEGHHASILQKAVAENHGVRVEDGMTWVRGYIAGSTSDQSRIFRSRSAIRSLFKVIEFHRSRDQLKELSWWDFEKLCEYQMKDMGYSIIDKVGDGGIDILATDSEGRYVIAQCKHWSRPIPVHVLREMVGTRHAYRLSTGIQSAAIVLSSSGFTKGSEEFAAQEKIQLVVVKSI